MSLPDFDQLQDLFRDPIQRRYEIIRPLILFHDRTAIQRAKETHTHPETVGTLKRRFEQQGMLGLFPDSALYQHSCYQPQSSYISLQASWICCCQVTEDRTFTDLQGLRNF